MGFTSSTYPALQQKVEARISRDLTKKEDINKDDEDTIVSDVLEDLLQESPTPPPKDTAPANAAPQASGSGGNQANRSDETLPGSWNMN